MVNFYGKVFLVLCAAALLAAPILRQSFACFKQHAIGKSFLLNGLLAAAIFATGRWLPVSIAWPQQLLLAIFMLELAAAASYYLAITVKTVFFSRQPEQVDLRRRRFLQHLFLAPAAAMVFYGGFYEVKKLHLQQHQLHDAGFGAGRFKIAQLSDAHLGRFFSLEKFRETLEQLAQLRVDLLAVTGDIFDDDSINKEAVAILASYCERFPQGIYYCWGNHEYRHNQPYLASLLAKTPVHVLVNSNVAVKTANGSFYLAGVDYPFDRENQRAQCAEYTKKALSGIPAGQLVVLLAHHSDFLDDGFANGVFLTMAGHTHGGQFCLAGKPLFPFFKYMLGMFEKNNCYGYVNVGAGSWFPYRIGCPPEISMFEITSERRGGEAQKFA